jgi:cytochrome c-type biogenesis protein CcmF
MYPAKWIFRKHEESPTTEVAIHRGFAQDVYLVLATFDAATQTASIVVDINPLVNWVWMGFGLLALGIGIALLPDAAFAFATVPLPANAATTALILLAVVLSQGVALAQDTVPAIFRSPLERRVAEEVMCSCGCRLSVANCGMMNCHGKEEQSAKIRQYVGEGQGHDAILASFVRQHGGYDVLMQPPNRGFNRVAWLLPYGVAGVCLLGVGLTALRWSRRPAAAAAAPPGNDPELDARLEHELRDLD